MRRTASALLLLGSFHAPASAASVPEVHALTGGRVVVAPGRVLPSGTVVLRGGVLEEVGAQVEIPPEARIWDCAGLTLYPGLIESYQPQGWPEEEGETSTPGAHWNALVKPRRDMAEQPVDGGLVGRLRQAGFTTAAIVPREALFRGHGVLINLGDGALGENLLRRRVMHSVTLRTASTGYPASLMGAVALFRQTLIDARWYGSGRAAYAAFPSQQRPDFNADLEEIATILADGEPWLFETGDVYDTLRLGALARELELPGVLVGNGEEYRRLEAVAATRLPIILPVSFPEAPEVEDGDELKVDIEVLRHWDEAPANPARLVGAGVEVTLTGWGLSDPRQLYPNLARAIERGLAPETALAALTTVPARLLGIDQVAGTLEPGKMANLLVVDGELFVSKPKIQTVWIDGVRYALEDLKPPEIDPRGRWEIEVDAGASGKLEARVSLAGEVTSLEGTISVFGREVAFSSVDISGSSVVMTYDGAGIGLPGAISMTMVIDGNTATGGGESPYGVYSLTATRTKGPTPGEPP